MVNRTPTYPLADVKADLANAQSMVISKTARRSSVALGMSDADVVEVVQSLSSRDFYKTMRGNDDPRIMHDVYKSEWKSIPLYLKFVRNFGAIKIMLISCKEDESYA